MHATPLRSSPKHNAVTLPTSFRFWNVLSTANSCSFRTIKAAKTVAPVRTYSTAGPRKRFTDEIIQSYTNNLRFTIIDNTVATRVAQDRHVLSSSHTELLGKSMSGVSLLASLLKGDERVKLQLLYPTPAVKRIAVEAMQIGEVRGYVDAMGENESRDPDRKPQLSVDKILYHQATPVTSVVELKKGDIVSDFEQFFELSEQIPSVVALETEMQPISSSPPLPSTTTTTTTTQTTGLDSRVVYSAGLLIQPLPNSPESIIPIINERVKQRSPGLFSRLKSPDYYTLSHPQGQPVFLEILKEILPASEFASIPPLAEMKRYAVDFRCRCSKEGFVGVMATLRPSDLEELYHDTDVHEMVCKYCSEKYQINKYEVLPNQ